MDMLLFFQLLLYMLGSILLVVLIVLSVKLIIVLDRAKGLIDNVEKKVNSFNGLFSVIDLTADKLSLLSDRVVDFASGAVRKIFKKNRKDDDIYE